MTLLGRLFKERAIRDNDLWGRWLRGDDIDAKESLSGVRITRETATQLSAVWACTSLITDAISTLPLDTFIRRDRARVPFRPRPMWLDEPNPLQTRQQWVSQQLMSLLYDGTAYVYTVRDRVGDIVETWTVPPWVVTPKRDQRDRIGYEITDPDLGLHAMLDRSEMFHIPALSWPGQIKGIPPLEAARRMLGTGLGAEQFAERYYGQGLNSAGQIVVPGDMPEDEAKELKAALKRRAGLRQAHLPPIFTGGAEWKPMTVSPEQAQFLEARRFTVGEIARFYRVPPHMIGDMEKSSSWGTGIEQQGIGFVTYTLLPWLERLEQSYTRHMLMLGPQSRAFTKFNVNGLLRGDFKARMEGYAIGRQWGIFSGDDVRALEDMPPLPDGKGAEYLVPLNMWPAGEPRPRNDPGDTEPA